MIKNQSPHPWQRPKQHGHRRRRTVIACFVTLTLVVFCNGCRMKDTAKRVASEGTKERERAALETILSRQTPSVNKTIKAGLQSTNRGTYLASLERMLECGPASEQLLRSGGSIVREIGGKPYWLVAGFEYAAPGSQFVLTNLMAQNLDLDVVPDDRGAASVYVSLAHFARATVALSGRKPPGSSARNLMCWELLPYPFRPLVERKQQEVIISRILSQQPPAEAVRIRSGLQSRVPAEYQVSLVRLLSLIPAAELPMFDISQLNAGVRTYWLAAAYEQGMPGEQFVSSNLTSLRLDTLLKTNYEEYPSIYISPIHFAQAVVALSGPKPAQGDVLYCWELLAYPFKLREGERR